MTLRHLTASLLAGAALLTAATTADAQDRARTLVITSPGVPNGLNYDGPASGHKPSGAAMVNMIEPLIWYEPGPTNADGMATYDYNKFASRLAESWTFDPATLTWTFKLRRGVKGCDGATFNADDVVYNFARGKSLSGGSIIFWFLANNASVANFTPAQFAARTEAQKAKDEGRPAPSPDARELGDEVKKVDDYTVQIRQSAPNKLFLTNLTVYAMQMYDKEQMQKFATAADPWAHEYTNNTGAPSYSPWCLTRWEKDKEISVRRNDDYYGAKPYFERVTVRKIAESASRLVTLQTGDSDMTEFLTPKEYDRLRSVRGVKVMGGFLNSGTMLWMNWTKPPFDNVKFRQAMAYLIPYDGIIDAAYVGQAQRWHGYVPTNYPGYHRPSTLYNTNVEMGKRLMAEAGYPNGQGLDKFADSFQLSYSIERESAMGPAATVIQTALKSAGVPVVLNPIPDAMYADRALVKKDMPLSMNDDSRPIGIDAGFATQLYFASVDKGGISNFSRYSNPMVDDLWAKAKVEGDEAKRNAMLAEIQEQLAKDVVWISLAEYKLQYAFKENIKGHVLEPGQGIRWSALRRE